MGRELIGREALERIVRRAAELQASETEIGEGLTEQELLALGQDVGIPARYLRQAMLEDQVRPAPARIGGVWGWLAGPPVLSAHRVVPGERPTVERSLARWMEEEELLQPKRRYADRTTWEARGGAFASIQRALGGNRRYVLAKTTEMMSMVTQLEPGFCLVQLSASVRSQRSARMGGLAALTGVGAAAGWAILLLGFAPAIGIAAAVAFGLGGVAIARTHAGENENVVVALEQVLDRLERGEIRPEHALPGSRGSTFVKIANEIRRALG
jgi:hypothetical protein